MLARKLGLPQEELLELRRRAAAEDCDPCAEDESAPGKPIGQWEPHDLEVHPAGPAIDGHGSSASPQRLLPGYVRRAHDQVLTETVRDAGAGHSRLLVLVGASSTGKTRACWEAVQPLADEGWRLWHPFDPTRAQAALEDIQRVRPRTVLWLNEAQHYLGDIQMGARIAAAIHTLLTDPDHAPVLVLGTLWSEYHRQYTAMPPPGSPDPHSRVRELLAARTLLVPDAFDAEALHAAAALGRDGDRLLADALTRTGSHGRVAQDLAGAPELLRRYDYGTPAGRALLEAAMDARRLGAGLHLPQAFLTDAATGYLTDTDYADLNDNWAEAAIAELAQPVHGKQAPMRRATSRPPYRPPGDVPATAPGLAAGPFFRLADYLEQHGRAVRQRLCPPASFWHAAHIHLTNRDDLCKLGQAARDRYRLQWAHHLYRRAADAGSTEALTSLAEMRERAGDRKGAEALAQQAADIGYPDALLNLATVRESEGDLEGAEMLAQRLAGAGYTVAWLRWAIARQWTQNRNAVESSSRQAPDTDDLSALLSLSGLRKWVEDQEISEAFHRRTWDAHGPRNIPSLSALRILANNREEAQALARQLADAGHTKALHNLARIWEKAGSAHDFRAEVWWPHGLDPDGTPTRPWQ
ncbi:tetratricopeptide repeat protein [Streptomyces sp. NPDC054962]